MVFYNLVNNCDRACVCARTRARDGIENSELRNIHIIAGYVIPLAYDLLLISSRK